MWADKAATLFIASLREGESVLDIGAGDDGNGFGSMCRAAGLNYIPFDYSNGQDWENWFQDFELSVDGVYMSHSLEHMHNPNSALVKIHTVLRNNGLLAITVPPMKDQIVGGHVTLWNAGLLLYNLVVAGFNCSKAAVDTYGYNCSVVVRRDQIENLPKLANDSGDINKLAHFFPAGLSEGFDGRLTQINWSVR